MGLTIISKSSYKDYNFGYSGLHQLRWVAYKICGGDKKFGELMSMEEGVLHPELFEFPKQDSLCKLKEPHYDWSYFIALQEFPNLMWHSDCDGSYTLTDEPTDFDKYPSTGNSRKFLRELENLNKMAGKLKNEIRWAEIFPQLYQLVKEVVEKGDGILLFS